ncbi:MAG TPA: helix-hairpin-helix domain-containing protein, partial [Thermoanaerobaculia bacterium]|nr:helix-hairpin-helix domain-containing protein [Thermoanaerobaculia bacterium]
DLSKAGVGAATIRKLGPLVTAGGAAAARPTRAGKAAAPASPGMVDINTASQKELEGLPGVGVATAKKIIAGRPYSSVADLSRVGVSAKTIEKLAPLVTAGAAGTAAAPSAPALPPAPSRRGEAAPAPAPPAPYAEAPSAQAPSAQETETPTPQVRTPPSAGMVWVNTATKVYHREGDPWYGRTKAGKFMTEADAIKAGYRASKQSMPRK